MYYKFLTVIFLTVHHKKNSKETNLKSEIDNYLSVP